MSTTHSTYDLSELANVSGPDKGDSIGRIPVPAEPEEGSAGAQFLRRVADAFAEAVEHENIPEEDDGGERHDLFHELADGCVPIYTHQRWLAFIDLCAYQEIETFTRNGAWEETTTLEVDGLPLSGDMTDMAGQVLYAIAVRLLNALHTEAVEAAEEAAYLRAEQEASDRFPTDDEIREDEDLVRANAES